jgi:hypothetical protein
MRLVELQERIRVRLAHGGSLAQVEAEIIDPSPFNREQRAALWLFASVTHRKLRREPTRPSVRTRRLASA